MLVYKCLIEVYDNTLMNACSGQRVIVEEKNDDKGQERQSVVTVQVSYIHLIRDFLLTYILIIRNYNSISEIMFSNGTEKCLIELGVQPNFQFHGLFRQ